MTGPTGPSRSGRVFLFSAGALFLLHAVLLLGAPSYRATSLLSNLIQLASAALAAIACLSAARRERYFPKHFWLFFAAGFLVWSLAQVVATIYDSILHAPIQQPWPSDLIFFLSLSLPLMTLFIDREGGLDWKQWPRIFDLVQVLILMLAVYLFTLEKPEAWRNGWGTIGQLAWIPETFRDIVLVSSFTAASRLGQNRQARALFGRMAIFLFVYLCGEVPYLYLQTHRGLRSGSPWDLVWSVPFLVATVLATVAPFSETTVRPPQSSAVEPRPGHWALTHLASLIFPLVVLLMAAGIAEKQLLAAAILVVVSSSCSIARILFAEHQQLKYALELKERNAFLKSVFEGTGDALFVKDLQGRYVIVNQTYSDLFELSPAEVKGKTPGDLSEPEIGRMLAEQDRVVVESGATHSFEYSIEWKGKTRTFQTTKAPHRDAEGKIVGLLGTIRDVTEYRQMEERLRQSQKMEAIGTLAGGVAHDFNNLLMVISGYSSVLAEALAGDPKLRGQVDQVLKAGERAASLTRQLLAFSRKQTIQPAPVNFNQIVTGIEKLLHRLIGEDIKINSRLASDLGTILADAGQMEQVILNLAVNARDAMPNGGELCFETRNVELGDPVASANGLRPGRYIEFLVRDTGVGMDLNVQARLFEPFFTTKPIGKGTGLGLSTAYGILKQANGQITFTSQPGHGTTFRIFLPRIDSEQPAASMTVTTDKAVHGQETVLVVEDDPTVCELVRAVLDSHGYRVLTSARPQDAEKVFQQSDGRVDLLVSDVVMPGISGTELAKRLAAQNPNVKVLFMSGYIGDAIVRAGIQEKDVAFLQKPFAPVTLVRKVREVLDGTRVGEA